MTWEDGINSELDFWRNWYATKGMHWPQDYLFRLAPDSEIQENIAAHLVTGYERILDVDAGPLTILGKKWKGKLLNIEACDALADYYAEINRANEISPLVITEQCKAEYLVDKYGHREPFDIIHAQNCIDHCEDPYAAILQMVAIVKPSGNIVLRHEVNEGFNEGYGGFHQWNFYAENDAFMISGKGNSWNITELLLADACVKTSVNDGFIENIITKL